MNIVQELKGSIIKNAKTYVNLESKFKSVLVKPAGTAMVRVEHSILIAAEELERSSSAILRARDTIVDYGGTGYVRTVLIETKRGGKIL